jgi:hypothetical protein
MASASLDNLVTNLTALASTDTIPLSAMPLCVYDQETGRVYFSVSGLAAFFSDVAAEREKALTPVFLGDFTNQDDITDAFGIERTALEPYWVLLAYYGDPADSYEWTAFVLLQGRYTGKLYEVNATHCSCYNLQGQWQAEETSIEALRARLEQGELGTYKKYWGGQRTENTFATELRQILDRLSASATS